MKPIQLNSLLRTDKNAPHHIELHVVVAAFFLVISQHPNTLTEIQQNQMKIAASTKAIFFQISFKV